MRTLLDDLNNHLASCSNDNDRALTRQIIARLKELENEVSFLKTALAMIDKSGPHGPYGRLSWDTLDRGKK